MQYTIFPKILLCAGLLAACVVSQPIVASLIALLFIYLVSEALTDAIEARTDSTLPRSLGLLILLSLWIVGGTICYYIFALPQWLAFMVSIVPLVFGLSLRRPRLPKIQRSGLYAFLPVLGISAASLGILAHVATREAIRSPWDIVPPLYFVLVAVMLLWLLILAFKKNTGSLTLAHCIAAAVPLLAVTQLVYPLGFGFDPFIHQAAEQLIAQHGVVYPKSPYYIGFYALVEILATITHLPLKWIDRWLVPMLTLTLFLPLAAVWLKTYAERFSIRDLTPHIGLLAIFCIPFFPLAFSTPLYLAYIFFTASLFVFLMLPDGPIRNGIVWLPAITALAIHPLVGIPLLVWLCFLFVRRYVPKTLQALYGIAASLVLPLVFIIAGIANPARTANLHLPSFSPSTLIAHLRSLPVIHFNLLLDCAKHLTTVSWFLFLVFAFMGFYRMWRRASAAEDAARLSAYLVLPFILLGNYLVLKFFLDFPYLISYETGAFSQRLLDLLWFSVLPFALGGFLLTLDLLRRTSSLPRACMSLLIVAIIVSSLYASYPTNDLYAKGRAINTSGADFAAVSFIATHARTDSYVVLANQQVSAAALATHGFARYSATDAGELFYYAIPTSSPLYQYYMDFVYSDPTRTPAEAAMLLTGAREVFIVMNDYWTDAANLIKKASPYADEVTELESGRVTILHYLQQAE